MAAELYDVVIIGAGISGLSAADKLLSKDPSLKIKILEAANRIGGRTETVHVTGPKGQSDTFDLGGHWVSDSQKEIMTLLKELDVDYYPQNINGTKVVQVENNEIRTYTSEIPNLKSWKALIEFHFGLSKAEKLCKELNIRDPYAHPRAHELDQMTLATYLKQHSNNEGVFGIFNSAIQAVLGADISQISALSYLTYASSSGGLMKQVLVENGCAQQFRVKGGTQQISEKLLHRIGKDLLVLNRPVRKIKQDGDDLVQLITDDGKIWRAKQVICTPPSTQIRKIEFDPPLPSAKRQLLEDMKMGNLCKVVVRYEEAFWLQDGFSGEVISTGGPCTQFGCENGPVTIWYDATTHNQTPALVGLYGGRNVDQWNQNANKDERRQAVIDQLVSFFGDKAAKPIDYLEKNWTDEKFIGGAPAGFMPTGTMHNFAWLRHPHGNVWFAGTDCAVDWCGYMSGAVQAGQKAAIDIIRSINPSALDEEDRALLNHFRVRRTDYRKVKREERYSYFVIKLLLVQLAVAFGIFLYQQYY